MKLLLLLLFTIITSTTYTITPIKTIIGYSTHKTPITSFRFGDGENLIIIIAGVHGNEGNTVITANYLITQLTRETIKIPHDKQVIIIPEMNPDGLKNKTRESGNKVDLNRNFDTKEWHPTSNYYNRIISSGKHPFSEPETKAIRDLIIKIAKKAQHTIVLTLHSRANAIFEASKDHYNIKLAAFLRENSNYNTIMDYPTFGDLERWLAEAHGIASATIEFKTKTKPDNEENTRILKAILHANIYKSFYDKH